MALSLNSFGSLLSKFTANHDVVTTAATASLLERTHYSSSGHSGHSGHSGGGYHHHYSSGKKHKRSIAMTALTLLSFLFFLNILQNCIQEHINQMNPTMMVMTMQTSAAIRKADRKGDDGAEIFENITSSQKRLSLNEPVVQNFKKNKVSVRKHEEVKITNNNNKGSRKGNTNYKGRNKGENGNTKTIKIQPTKASLYVPDDDYEYTHIPIKLKTQTVELYNYKKKP